MLNENAKKVWYNVELSLENAEIYKNYLFDNDIYFEPSSCFNLIHFEIKMTPAEAERADAFLQTLY